jgi:hypothetical protein
MPQRNTRDNLTKILMQAIFQELAAGCLNIDNYFFKLRR